MDRKEKLRQDLADEEYRDAYAMNALIGQVSDQVQALRRQRVMSQADLAQEAKTQQPRISALESPPKGGKLPNWELQTLWSVARALGTRLKISFETYGSLIDELDSVTSDSLRRCRPESDPKLLGKPLELPTPDREAPEPTQWMQEMMIPWLCSENLELGRLVDWLSGRGLPPVGHEEEPYQWILRGIAVPGDRARDFLERSLAERLAVVLGEQPDIAALTEGNPNEFLRNLYWTCSGLQRHSVLGEPLWGAYKRLRHTKLPGAVRDSLQAAMVHNQVDPIKPLREIWEPMVKNGRHHLLRGSEKIGYRGIVERYAQFGKQKPHLEQVVWALGEISRRWDQDRKAEFEELVADIPDLGEYTVARQLVDAAYDEERRWSNWARRMLPVLNADVHSDGSMTVRVYFAGCQFYAVWPSGGHAQTGIKGSGDQSFSEEQDWGGSKTPDKLKLMNALLTHLSDDYTTTDKERAIAYALVRRQMLKISEEARSEPSRDRSLNVQIDESAQTALIGATLLLGLESQR